MATKLDSRQVVLRAQSPFIGNAANEQLDVVFPRIDAEMAKLFEDRNVLLVDGGIITFTGTQIQFTEALRIAINQNIAGVAPYVASLGSATITLANNEMVWAIVNRTAATATLAQGLIMPAVIAANQEVFLIAKRVDAGDGTQRLYWRTGMAQDAGQSNRLGASGSGSGGSGTGDDLNALLFQASFTDKFEEGPSDSKSAVDVTAGFTDSTTYSAAKKMYTLNYDASKTIAAATTTTNINLSAVAAFTVKIGDMVIANNQARRITAVATQASYTTEAFSVAPTLGAQVTVSQAVYTKDIYNLPVGANALSAEFGAATFQEVMFDYEDTTAAGDDIYDVNSVPVIALAASQNGTTFTDVKTRPTLGTSTIQSFMLPAAGTGLYVRLFANKTSGSGIVNILGYKAFMQKLATATAGGITNSSYAFTNGVGTPINAVVGLSGGKTTITIPWQYAVGVLPGTTASSIEVWLNGQKLPRFVDATLTPDGSFLETSSNVITLDSDYSQLNLAVEIFQRNQIVDSSTTNTTAISYNQEIQRAGFQSFVSENLQMNPTTNTGSPAAGTFHSTVVNRSAMRDLSQDLSVRMGISRMTTHSLTFVPNEYGPNNEIVYRLTNDTANSVRLVGHWYAQVTAGGPQISSSGVIGDYMEVTFFGTGLNILTNVNTTAFDARVSVDGGAEGANVMPNANPFQNSRNYNPNIVIPVASGLAQGVHTVKFRNNSVNTVNIQSFEVINNTTTLRVNPGTSYAAGNKLALASAVTPSYNSVFESGTLGTRGGHVVVYQKADGTIGKAVTPTGSQLNTTSASHANEELIRSYNWREFGSGLAVIGDFSLAGTGSFDGAFFLDDDSTGLYGSGNQSVAIERYDALRHGVNGSYWTLTFVGTGLDIMIVDTNNGGSDTYTGFIDGVSIGQVGGTAGINKPRMVPVVSGLPYGTHTFRLTRVTAATYARGVVAFHVYQPKKPTIPAGATELADYNIMATYVADAVGNFESVSTGVLRKMALREITFGGSWSGGISQTIGTDVGGFTLRSTTNGDYFEYTFFGTGFEAIMRGGSAGITSTILVDGVAYTGTATALTGGSWTPGTSTWISSTSGGSMLQVNGLTLGMHTVRVTLTNAAGTANVQGFNVITPIHVHRTNTPADIQNALAIGSQGVTDGRKWTPVKDALSGKKAFAQAFGIASSPTTTSTTFVPAPDLSVAIKTGDGTIEVEFTAMAGNNSVGASTYLQAYVDGLPVGVPMNYQNAVATQSGAISGSVLVPVSAGTHNVDVYWRAETATSQLTLANRMLKVTEK